MLSSGNDSRKSSSHHRKRKHRRFSGAAWGSSSEEIAQVCPVCETLLPVDTGRRQPEDHILDLLRSVFTRGGGQSFYNRALQMHWDSFFTAMPADFPIPYCRLCCMHFPGFIPFAHHLCERASLVVDTKSDRLHAELLGHFIVFVAGVVNPALELRLQAERAGEFLCRRCQPGIEKLQLKSVAANAAAKAAAATAAAVSRVSAAAAVSSSSDVAAVKAEPECTPSALLPPPSPASAQSEQQQTQPEHQLQLSSGAFKREDVKQAKPPRQRLLFRNRSSLLLCNICHTGVDNLAAHLLSVLRCLQPPIDQRVRTPAGGGTARSALAEYRRSHVSQLIGECVSARIERYNTARTVLMCPACQLHFHSPSSFYSYFFYHLAKHYREDQPEQAHTVLLHRIVSLLIDYVADRVSADDVEKFFTDGKSGGGNCGFFCDAGGLELRHARNGTGACVGQQRITDFVIEWIVPPGSPADGLLAAASVWRRHEKAGAAVAASSVVADSPTATDATIIVPNNADVVCQYCGAGFSGRHHLSALHNHLLRALFLGSCEEEAGDLPGAAEASQRRHRLCWSAFAPAGRPARCTACGRICNSLELLAEHIGDRILRAGSASHHAVAEDIAEMLLDVATGRAAHERACSYMENFLLLSSGFADEGSDAEIEFPASASAVTAKTDC